MKIPIKFEEFYRIKHNAFTRIYSAFLIFDGRKTNVILKTFIAVGLIFFRWLSFIALKVGLSFSTVGVLGERKFPVRSTNSQFCSIYFRKKNTKFYEPEVYGTIQALLPLNGVFVDVGSNWGHHSFIAAKSKNATVFAFEPNPAVACDMRKINEVLDIGDVKLFEYAIGNSEGSLTLKQNYFESGTASLNSKRIGDNLILSRISFYLHSLAFNKPIAWTVKVMKLDDVLRSCKMIDLIKIDVEGVEMEVLKGSLELLKQHKPSVVFEINSSSSLGCFEMFNQFFAELGYETFKILSTYREGISI